MKVNAQHKAVRNEKCYKLRIVKMKKGRGSFKRCKKVDIV